MVNTIKTFFQPKRRHEIEEPYVRHINRQWRYRVPILSTIINLNIPTIIFLGFILSLACVTIFALIYWSIDQKCYVVGYNFAGISKGGHESINFQKMFALSAQTFTTVGYGGIYVRCWHTNILVTLEWYISLIVGATVSGVLIVNLLSPPPMVRWSKNILLTNWKRSLYTEFLESYNYGINNISNRIYEGASLRTISSTDKTEQQMNHSENANNNGNLKALCLRCASESTYQLTSFNVEAVAYILRIDTDKGVPIGTFIEPLQLLHSKNVVYHQFGIAHVIDEASPLYQIEIDGEWNMLQKVVCTATYYDPRFKTDNVSYHTYWNNDLIQNAIFKSMATPGNGPTIHDQWNSREYDHSLIDEYIMQTKLGDSWTPMTNQSPLPDGMA